jgi:hypothetical protein
MDDRNKRVIIRAIAIGVQWIALTGALGAIVMRTDDSFSQIISPTFGPAAVFFGAAIAGFLLGLTVESPRFLAPLVILMAFVAASFIGVLSYAPVVDGVLVRTASLDNWVSQRVILMSLIMFMAMIPTSVAGNLLGGHLRIRQEIAPHPEDMAHEHEVPWWEQRYGSGTEADSTSGDEAGRHTV